MPDIGLESGHTNVNYNFMISKNKTAIIVLSHSRIISALVFDIIGLLVGY